MPGEGSTARSGGVILSNINKSALSSCCSREVIITSRTLFLPGRRTPCKRSRYCAATKLLLIVAVISPFAIGIHRFGLSDLITNFRHLQQLIGQSGTLGYVIYITLFIVATVCLMPGSVLVLAGGMVFGPWLGTLLSLVAATLASALSFLLARWIGRTLLLKYVGHTATFQAIERGMTRSGTDFLILTRLIPLFPYNIQNYAYGLTAIPFWRYTLISALTTLPGIFIYTYMASELVAQGITQPFVLKLSLAGVVLFALVQTAKGYARRKRVELPTKEI